MAIGTNITFCLRMGGINGDDGGDDDDGVEDTDSDNNDARSKR
jgi:hypothetical protein